MNSHETDWIDEDDAPELTDAFFEQADEYKNGVLVKRGCSSIVTTKTAIKLRIHFSDFLHYRKNGNDVISLIYPVNNW